MFGFPGDASLHGHEVDAAVFYLTVTTGICFLLMMGVLGFSIARHREGRLARYFRGEDRWNVVIAGSAAALVFVAVDLVSLVRSWKHLEEGIWAFPEEPGGSSFRVEVTAQQWNWTFRYPGRDGVFATADDIVTLDELRVPVDRPVFVQLRAKDVVHSFYLPNFRTKVDAIPGHVTRLWFVPRATGTFEIACSQHCGVGHYRMRGELKVTSEADWQTWAERAARDTAARVAGLASSAGSPVDGWAWESRR